MLPGEGTDVGGGTPVANPWAAYGLNADGSPIEKKETPAADPRDAKLAELGSKLAAAEERLGKLPSDFEGMTKKMEVVDRLVKALGGEGADPKSAENRKIWAELKDVAKHAAPGFFRQMERYENDPDAGERAEKTANALAQARLSDLNTNAHQEVMTLAKGVFKGLSSEELAEAVYPFESTMTEMINANPQLAQRFVNGDMSLIRDMFQRLAKPHLAGRLRQKQSAMQSGTFGKAMPKGSGAPAAGEGDTPKKDLSTRKGREAFHKQAIGRFMDRRTSSDD